MVKRKRKKIQAKRRLYIPLSSPTSGQLNQLTREIRLLNQNQNRFASQFRGFGNNLQQVNRTVGTRVPNQISRVQADVSALENRQVPLVAERVDQVLEFQSEGESEIQELGRNVRRGIAEQEKCCSEAKVVAQENVQKITINTKEETQVAVTNINNYVREQTSIQANNTKIEVNKNYKLIQEKHTLVINKIELVYRQITIQFNRVNNNLRTTQQVIVEKISQLFDLIINFRNQIKVEIQRQGLTINATLELVLSAIGAVEVSVGAVAEAFSFLTININGDFAFLTADILRTQWNINYNTKKVGDRVFRDVRGTLAPQLRAINNSLQRIERKLDKLTRDHEECCEEMPERVGKVVGLYVVGDSWYRWDGTHTYYPTLCFKFKELESMQYPRTSQIQIKLKEDNKALTDADIEKLRNLVKNLGLLEYKYGSNRGYFVAKNRRFKTTVYGDSRYDIEKVLKACLSVVGEDFDSNYLSYTENVKRENIVKRNTTLFDVPTNPVNYKKPSTQQLFRVMLLVNGMQQPIIIKE